MPDITVPAKSVDAFARLGAEVMIRNGRARATGLEDGNIAGGFAIYYSTDEHQLADGFANLPEEFRGIMLQYYVDMVNSQRDGNPPGK